MKDFLIRVMAVQLMKSERVIEQVVNHQFTSASEAMKSNDEIELSGFGKFVFNRKKALKKLIKMEGQLGNFSSQRNNASLSSTKRMSAELKLANALNNYRILKTKLYGSYNEDETDLRGLEERFVASVPSKRADRERELGENDNMRGVHIPLGSEKEKTGV